MISLANMWLPIVLSAVFVFVASSLINMLLKFWHAPDYHGFSNEDEVAAAMRKSGATPGAYMMPYCKGPEELKNPAMLEKFKQGPVAHVNIRAAGPMNLGAFLGLWFVFCLLVSVACAGLAVHALPAHPDPHVAFHTIGLAALLGYSFGEIPNAIWRAQPWVITIKYFIDGIVYALITAFTFCWLWPA
jgi:hypothetical protein